MDQKRGKSKSELEDFEIWLAMHYKSTSTDDSDDEHALCPSQWHLPSEEDKAGYENSFAANLYAMSPLQCWPPTLIPLRGKPAHSSKALAT